MPEGGPCRRSSLAIFDDLLGLLFAESGEQREFRPGGRVGIDAGQLSDVRGAGIAGDCVVQIIKPQRVKERRSEGDEKERCR